MKRIKIVLIILIVLCSLVQFVACDPSDYYFTQEELSDIVSIELINYENPAQKSFFSWVPDHTSDLKPFDNKKVCVLESLAEDKFSQFVETLCDCLILETYFAYDSPKGICVKKSYSDGDFLILSCNEQTFAGYVGKFSSDGEVARFIGCFCNRDSFEALVNDYFVTNL